MSKPLRTQFVIADAARARWVRRSDNGEDFVTIKELKADRGEPKAPVAPLAGSGGRRTGLREARAAARHKRERFAAEVSHVLDQEAASGAYLRLAVVAPARTLSAICNHLSITARARLAASLSKDLTKVADHELAHWLTPLEFETRSGG